MLEDAYALVVGIAQYQGIRTLPGTVLQDAADIARTLSDPAICGYPSDHVTLLHDDKATRAAILAALADLAARCDNNSTVLIYYSGHGGYVETGPRAGAYLLPVDVDSSSSSQLDATALSDKVITEALAALKARRVVVFFDCCHAGGLGDPVSDDAPPLQAGLPTTLFEALSAGTGRVIIASSRSTELSWIVQGERNSLFTYHLLHGLRGGARSQKGLIHILDLFEYLQPRVTQSHADQHPILKAELEENFPIALHKGGQHSAD